MDDKDQAAAPSVEAQTEVSSAVLNPVYLTPGKPDTPRRFRAKRPDPEPEPKKSETKAEAKAAPKSDSSTESRTSLRKKSED